MAANEALSALNVTDVNNTPSGGDTIGTTMDDEIRSLKARIAQTARFEHASTASAATTFSVSVLHRSLPLDGSAGGATTFTLPAAATAGDGFLFHVFKGGTTNAVIIDGNGAETIDGQADLTLSAVYTGMILVCDGANWGTIRDTRAAATIQYQDNNSISASTVQAALDVLGAAFGVPYGFALANNGSDANHDLDIGAGQRWDSTYTYFLVGSAMTKQIDATWAAGTNAGGLDTGVVAASTCYAIYAIRKDSDGTIDYIFSTAHTWAGVTKPSGYTYGGKIGSLLTNASSNIHAAVWSGDTVRFTQPDNVVNDTTITNNTLETYTLPAPPLSEAEIFFFGLDPTSSSSAIQLFVTNGGETGAVLTGQLVLNLDMSVDAWDDVGVRAGVVLDSSSRLSAGMTESGAATLSLYLSGWREPGLLSLAA